MDGRKRQLLWYNGDTIVQDVELEQFVSSHNVTRIGYRGDSEYLKEILGKEQTYKLDLCVYIVNHHFKFSELVLMCNQIICTLIPNGHLYLAINKFLAEPEYFDNAVEDYDDSIVKFIQSNINYPMVKYHCGKDDGGRKFNGVHPITRFYFQNDNPL